MTKSSSPVSLNTCKSLIIKLENKAKNIDCVNINFKWIKGFWEY